MKDSDPILQQLAYERFSRESATIKCDKAEPKPIDPKYLVGRFRAGPAPPDAAFLNRNAWSELEDGIRKKEYEFYGHFGHYPKRIYIGQRENNLMIFASLNFPDARGAYTGCDGRRAYRRMEVFTVDADSHLEVG